MSDALFTELSIDAAGRVHTRDILCRAIGCKPFVGCRSCLGAGCHACEDPPRPLRGEP